MSSNQWKTCLIGDIGRIITGKTPSTKNPENFGNKYPFVTPRDMLGQKKIWQTERYLSEVGKNEVKNCLLPANAVCISCIGSDMGKVVMTTQESVTNQQLNSIICDNSFDPEFVYYGVINISSDLKNVAHHSTAVPILNKTDFSNFEFRFPDIYAQKRIASIFSALDDKIELNRETNQTLEAIAQAIYKEWFVNFNFPGATGEMQDNELGPIPKGWRIGKVKDLVEIQSGFAFKGDSFIDTGNYKIITIKNVQDGLFDSTKTSCIDDIPERMSEYCKLNERDILLSLTGNVGRICFVYGQNMLLNQRVAKLWPKEQSYFGYVYTYFRSESVKNDLISLGKGTAQQNLSPIETQNKSMIMPPRDILLKYGKIVNSLYEMFIRNLVESQYLTETRDILLPKLMSGEIEV